MASSPITIAGIQFRPGQITLCPTVNWNNGHGQSFADMMKDGNEHPIACMSWTLNHLLQFW